MPNDEERRPYLMFSEEHGPLLGLTGPYRDRSAAQAAMDALLAAEATAMRGWDLDSVAPAAQCIYVPYHHIRVADLSPAEIEALRPGQPVANEESGKR